MRTILMVFLYFIFYLQTFPHIYLLHRHKVYFPASIKKVNIKYVFHNLNFNLKFIRFQGGR